MNGLLAISSRIANLGGAGAGGGLTSSQTHLMLAGLGFVPIVGELADAVDAVLYFVEGDTQGALLSAAAMVPFAGNVAGAAKAARLTDNAAGVVRGTKVTASSAGNASSGIRRTDFPHTTPNPNRTGPSGAAKTGVTVKPSVGQKLYRVYGGDSKAGGASWSPVDPQTVRNLRDLAGLPSGGASGATNTGQFLIEGTLNDPAAVVLQRSALPLDGMKGGFPEYIIPNWVDSGSITIRRVSGVNPEF